MGILEKHLKSEGAAKKAAPSSASSGTLSKYLELAQPAESSIGTKQEKQTEQSGTIAKYVPVATQEEPGKVESIGQGLEYTGRSGIGGLLGGLKSLFNAASYESQFQGNLMKSNREYFENAENDPNRIYEAIDQGTQFANAMEDKSMRQGKGEADAIMDNAVYTQASKLGDKYNEETQQKYGGTTGGWKVAADLAQTVGQQVPAIALNAVPGVGQALSSAYFFGSAMGSGIDEALAEGADMRSALDYGQASGIVEMATEKVFDGMAGLVGAGAMDEITEALIGKVAKKSATRNMLRILVGAMGEGTEEVMSDLANPIIKTIYNGQSVGQNYRELSIQDMAYDYLLGALSGGLLGSVGTVNGEFRTKNNVLDSATVQTALQEFDSTKTGQRFKTIIEAVSNENTSREDLAEMAKVINENGGNITAQELIQAREDLLKAGADQQTAMDTAQEMAEVTRSGREEELRREVKKAMGIVDEAEMAQIVDKATGKVVFEGVDEKNLNARQKATVNMAKAMAGWAGNNVHFYASQLNENGEMVMPENMRASVGEKAPNGWYDHKTGDIFIDINAGNSGMGTGVYTLAHEYTHFIANNAAESFGKLAEFLEPEFEKQGKSFDELVKDQMAKAEASGRSITEEVAREEVIADAMEGILTGTDAAERIAQLKTKDLTLWQKLKELVSRMLASVKKAYEGLNPDSQEGRMVLEMRDKLEDISKLFAEGFEEASNNYQNQGPMDVSQEMDFSRRNDAQYMEDAKAYNEKEKAVDEAVLARAAEERAEVKRLLEREKTLKIIPEDIEGNTSIGNASYGYSQENGTVCTRSLAVDGLLNQVSEELGRPLTFEESMFVCQEAMNYTDKPECLYCYVANDRKAYTDSLGKYFEQREKAIQLHNEGKTVEEIAKEALNGAKVTKNVQNRMAMWFKAAENGEAMLQPKDVAGVTNEKNFAAKRRAELPENLREEFDVARKYAQSASHAKGRNSYVAYNGNILKMSQKVVNTMNKMYGMRMYSFTDYSPAFILENMQMITDAAVRKLKVLAYTKELGFVRVFGDTGANINISTFAMAEPDADGNFHMDAMQGADWTEAQQLRRESIEKGTGVGITFVATSDAQVEWAMAQDWIDVVIPYHSVFTGGGFAARMFGWKDYKAFQEDKKGKNWEKGNKKTVYPSEHNNDLVTYARALYEQGLEPRFANWIKGYGDFVSGNITEQEFRDMNPNYMKLVNETRRGANMTPPVQPIFNQQAAEAEIDEMTRRGTYYNPIGVSFDEEGNASDNSKYIAEETADKIRGKSFSYGGDRIGEKDTNKRTFSYEELVKKEPITGTVIGKNVKISLNGKGIDKEDIKRRVFEKCKQMKTNATTTTYYLEAPDLGKKVVITGDGILHGGFGNAKKGHEQKNIRAVLALPEILQGAIEVNRKPGRNPGIDNLSVMMGIVGMEEENDNVDIYAVRILVEQRNKIGQDPVLISCEITGKLKAINAKKIVPSNAQIPQKVSTLHLPSTIFYNVADYIDDVKDIFGDTFSNDVYQKKGMERDNRNFGKELLFSNRGSYSVRDERVKILDEFHIEKNRNGIGSLIEDIIWQGRDKPIPLGRVETLMEMMLDAGTAEKTNFSDMEDPAAFLQGHKVYVPEKIRKGMGADRYNDMRKALFGYGLYLTNNQNDQKIDSVWAELCSRPGGGRFDDTMAQEDILMEMWDILQQAGPQKITLREAWEEEAYIAGYDPDVALAENTKELQKRLQAIADRYKNTARPTKEKTKAGEKTVDSGVKGVDLTIAKKDGGRWEYSFTMGGRSYTGVGDSWKEAVDKGQDSAKWIGESLGLFVSDEYLDSLVAEEPKTAKQAAREKYEADREDYLKALFESEAPPEEPEYVPKTKAQRDEILRQADRNQRKAQTADMDTVLEQQAAEIADAAEEFQTQQTKEANAAEQKARNAMADEMVERMTAESTPREEIDRENDDRLAQLFGELPKEEAPVADAADAVDEFVKTIEDQMPGIAQENTEEKDPASKIGTRVSEKNQTLKERIQKAWHGFVRKMVNSADAVHQMALRTGEKALDGYFFFAKAARQRANDWVTRQRTTWDGKTKGKSLNDILGDIKTDEKKYRDFQLYMYHLLNVDRHNVNFDAERAVLQEQLEFSAEEHPEFATMSRDKLETLAYKAANPDITGEEKEYCQAAEEYLQLMKERDYLERKVSKPVFGFDGPNGQESALAAQELETEEFKTMAQEVYDYVDALLQYRVDAGLITADQKKILQEKYPHYIPCYYEGKRAEVDMEKWNTSAQVSTTIKMAKGGDGKILPMHAALGRQTCGVMQNAGINSLANAIDKAATTHKDSTDVVERREEPNWWSETAADNDDIDTPKSNDIVFIQDGKRIRMTVTAEMAEAFRSMTETGDKAGLGWLEKMNNGFKKLCTSFSPLFMLTNPIRDVQDAMFFSEDFKHWTVNYPKAAFEIRNNGEYWQMYSSMGGVAATYFDWATGNIEEGKGIGKIEALNMAIEQMPRLAEFMTVMQAAEKRGNVTDADRMHAFNAAQEITTNFGRSGVTGQAINRYWVPFWNPSVQGLAKVYRTMAETKGAKEWTSLVFKAAALGVLPAVINGLMYRDDDEWDDITDEMKVNYYLFKVGDGVWAKIPKGRVLAALSAGAVGVQEYLRGDTVEWEKIGKAAVSAVAPNNPLESNLFAQAMRADLFDADSPGKTWYGGDIESQRLQGYAPGKRYDESTDYISKWIGGKLNISPKKLNYIIDNYSGIIGDVILPYLTPKAERGMYIKVSDEVEVGVPLSQAFLSRFTVDTVSNNKISGEYYDMKDQLGWAEDDQGADEANRYLSRAGSEISDLYSQIREIENDTELTDREKTELTRELRREINAQMEEIMANTDRYHTVCNDYLEANPELNWNDSKAVEAWTAEYNSKQSSEEYFITEAQAKDKMENQVYRETNQIVFGSEYALQVYNRSVWEKADELNKAAGISFDDYYDYYFDALQIHADYDDNGKAVSGSKKTKVLALIDSMDLTSDQKDALYLAAGYGESTISSTPWHGGTSSSSSSGSSSKKRKGSSRSTKLTQLKLTAPKSSGNMLQDMFSGNTSANMLTSIYNVAKPSATKYTGAKVQRTSSTESAVERYRRTGKL